MKNLYCTGQGHKVSLVDDKGRIALPICFRRIYESQNTQLHLTGHFSRMCLVLRTDDEWKEVEAFVNSVSAQQKAYADIIRRVISPRTIVSYDSNGRVLIPSAMRKSNHIRCGGSVIIAGMPNNIEIWDEGTWVEQYELSRNEGREDLPADSILNN